MTHLHHHSCYSFLDGYGLPEQIAARLQELGHWGAAITDHGNVIAHVPWQKAARAAGLVPLFGCEFYVVDDMTERSRVQVSLGASAIPHVTVIAMTEGGYRNLLRLSRLSYQEGFYYKPRIDWDALIEHQAGLAILSGCAGGYPSRLIEGKGVEAAHEFLLKLSQRLEHLYVEVVPEPGLEISHLTSGALVQVADDLGLPIILTADSHFPKPSDYRYQDLMLAVGTGQPVRSPNRPIQLPSYQYTCSEAELIQRAVEVAPEIPRQRWVQAVELTERLAKVSQFDLPLASKVVFAGLISGEETADEMLWRWVQEGVVVRKSAGLIPSDQEWDYYHRAKREYDTLRQKGFCDYLLAIGDVCRHVKEAGGLVNLRGSAGGCLLLWLIGASEMDPIRHGLSFERFYDDNRPDPPDVDIDFERAYRQLAIDYVYDLYGRENCCQIAALSKLKAKGAVQDACKGLGIPRSVFAPLSAALDAWDEDMDRQIEEITDPAALSVLRRHPELADYVGGLVGQYRQSSIHAAGVLVSNHPVGEVVGVLRGQAGQVVASVDKRGAAELGFLKMDFLSVNALDVIGTTVRRLGRPMSWLTTLPLDDQEALALGQRGFLAGVFQLDGGSAARVSRQIGLHSFDDLCAAGALCRPGPADWVPMYQRYKDNPQELEAYLAGLHPIAANLIRPTFGVLVYQEQVMTLARELAQFSWAEVHKLRKGVTDKLGLNPNTGPAWREEWGSKFITGCLKSGCSEEEAVFWWHSVQSHGGYSFNKSHCYSYGLVGYWMLYLKAHHPAEFYESYLSLEDRDVTVKRLILEFRQLGGEVRLLDPPHVGVTFCSPGPGVLAGGLTNLKGVGQKSAERALVAGPPQDWSELLASLGPAQARRLEETGVTRGRWDPQATIALAPWFPVPVTGPEEVAAREEFGLLRPSDLPPLQPSDGPVTAAGYVTAGKAEGDKIAFLLEDETGLVLFRVPYKYVKEIGPQFQQLVLADFVAVYGWWSGEVLYARGVEVISRWPGHQAAAPTARRTAKQQRQDLLSSLPDLPEL